FSDKYRGGMIAARYGLSRPWLFPAEFS
ncbi:short chain dehydrogenase [Oceanospirillum sp. MED92]|nr:short chain dehydrogenase [Oceanospirillum sp. MED92] [Neptuniibacter caesariensis]